MKEDVTLFNKTYACNFKHIPNTQLRQVAIPCVTVNIKLNDLFFNKRASICIPKRISRVELLYDSEARVVCLSCTTVKSMSCHPVNKRKDGTMTVGCSSFLNHAAPELKGAPLRARKFGVIWDEKKVSLLFCLNQPIGGLGDSE